MKTFFVIFIGIILICSACENPAENKTKAVTTEANSTPIAKQTKGEALKFSSADSKVDFVGSKVTGKEAGRFQTFSGTIDLVNNKPEESQVSVEIEMGSVVTDSKGLDEHLKNADFFEVEKYPKAAFISSKITPDKEANTFSVTGELDFHGVKKSITFPAKIIVSEKEVTVESEFFINRRDFNVNYAGRANDLIRDEVVLKLNIQALRKK
jgi:polyisoprenoid-binding protein YceI